jgi:hypothetical protein
LHNIVRLGLFLDEKKNEEEVWLERWVPAFLLGENKKEKCEKSMIFGVGN